MKNTHITEMKLNLSPNTKISHTLYSTKVILPVLDQYDPGTSKTIDNIEAHSC